MHATVSLPPGGKSGKEKMGLDGRKPYSAGLDSCILAALHEVRGISAPPYRPGPHQQGDA